MKVLVFGAAGQVGSCCTLALKAAGFDVIALTRRDADFSQPSAAVVSLNYCSPDFVVNACAYTAVDKAEKEAALANVINAQSIEEIAKWCARHNTPLLYLSTDYVFDGEANAPYEEDSPVNPLSVYGASKLAGEKAILDSLDLHIVLRTSWLFGEHGDNFVNTMLNLAQTHSQLRVVDDQVGRPTYVGHLVGAIVHCVNAYAQTRVLPWGVYHCCSEGEISWHGFASAIFQMAEDKHLIKSSPDVLPIPSSEYPTLAPRPKYSVLSTQKLTDWVGRPMPHWRDGLTSFFLTNVKTCL